MNCIFWCSTCWEKSFISPSLNAYCCWERSCGKQFSTCQDLITGHYCWITGSLLLLPVFSGDHTFNLVCNVRKIPTTKTIMVCKKGWIFMNYARSSNTYLAIEVDIAEWSQASLPQQLKVLQVAPPVSNKQLRIQTRNFCWSIRERLSVAIAIPVLCKLPKPMECASINLKSWSQRWWIPGEVFYESYG